MFGNPSNDFESAKMPDPTSSSSMKDSMDFLAAPEQPQQQQAMPDPMALKVKTNPLQALADLAPGRTADEAFLDSLARDVLSHASPAKLAESGRSASSLTKHTLAAANIVCAAKGVKMNEAAITSLRNQMVRTCCWFFWWWRTGG